MAQVTKKELIARIAEETGETKKVVEAVLKAEHALIPTLLAEVKSEKEDATLTITGFGTYKISHVPARKGKNPRNTEQEIDIPASYRVKFSAGTRTKEIANA